MAASPVPNPSPTATANISPKQEANKGLLKGIEIAPLDFSFQQFLNKESTLNFEVHKDESKTRMVIGLSIGGGVLVVGIGLAWLLKLKMKTRGKEDDLDLIMDSDFERGTGPKRFSYNELVRTTNNFANELKLGEGGVEEYASEVKIISKLRHRNLVQLLGWCHKKNDLLLIYELMPNGSLDSHLFGGKSLLTWAARYNIAGGLASALLYLHEEWEQCVLHRDLKSTHLPSLPSKMPKATYIVPSITASASSNPPSSSADAFGPNKTELLSSGSYTGSPESKTSAALLHSIEY
ncbi:hypothetical protein JHK85_042172 [Glycine max]|nr:hypothetical protein JHK85_042172 [Glycine max]